MIWNDLRDWSEMEYFKEIEKTGDRLLKDFAIGIKLGAFSRRAGKSEEGDGDRSHLSKRTLTLPAGPAALG